MEFLKANYDWIFSGAGVVIAAGLVTLFRKTLAKGLAAFSGRFRGKKISKPSTQKKRRRPASATDMESLCQRINILFIDDDIRFRVASMLGKWGRVNTRQVKDILSIDDEKVQDAQILFVDIYGTGLIMGFAGV